MKCSIKISNLKACRTFAFLVTCLCFFNCPVFAQQAANAIIVDLSPIDGIEITPDNVFNYRILNNGSRSIDVEIKGSLKYKNSPLQFSYSFPLHITAGMNAIGKEKSMSAVWKFSDNAFKELFFNYKKLPQGTYEYCVTIDFSALHAENYSDAPVDGCIYQSVNDIFLLNLIDPEDDAKIYETNPMLIWTVNHPIASMLTYKLRIAELKKGQNNINAISRNNPVYEQRNLSALSLLYPLTAKPLQKFQPYAWTVDAYYKNILLGGAEIWKFTIIEDSILKAALQNNSYVDIRLENGNTQLYIPGELKLKYVLEEASRDTLTLELHRKNGNETKLTDVKIPVIYGDNRFSLALQEKYHLKHGQAYVLRISSGQGLTYLLPFTYLNPEFIRQ